VVLCCALVACVNYEARPLQPQQTAERFGARRLDAPELRDQVAQFLPRAATQWPPKTWDRATLLAVALVSNPKLAVARAQVQAARAHEGAVAQPANPDLTLQSEYARHDPHPWLYGFNLDFPLRSPARKRLETDLARLGTGNAQWQLMDQVWVTRRSLIAALSEHELAQRRVQILEQLASAQERLVAIEDKRVAAGEDAPRELLLARQARIGVAQQQAEARTGVGTAQAAIAAALGVPSQALDGVALHWPEWGEPPTFADSRLRESREAALLSRADLAAAIGDYAETENRLEQAVLRQYPQLHLTPGYYWDHGIAKFPFDIGFTLPLFNRGEIAEARAARELAGQRMLALQADVYGEIAAAERAEDAARASADAAAQNLRAAQQQAEQTKLAIRLGAIGVEEELGAQILLLRSEFEALQLRGQWQGARDALEDALHAPLSGPELELSMTLPVVVAGPQ
jgi:CRISPR system Cascade subunit CasA